MATSTLEVGPISTATRSPSPNTDLVWKKGFQLEIRMTTSLNSSKPLRQRLLYLHARTPSVFSSILGYTPIEPVKGYQPEISAEEIDWPYLTVHDAIVDGWQIVQFPHLQAPFDDADLDVVGYEFILQKMEVVDG